ncbi:MAG TPA: hypothetical protein VF269_00905 [Rhodanobacteraceae bacterium]
MVKSANPSVSMRRYMLRIALWSLGIGVVLALAGWWMWRPVFYLGCVMGLLGVGWLAGLPMQSRDPVTPAFRHYIRTVLPAMGGYVLAVLVFDVVKVSLLPPWARVLVALLPVLPMVWVVFAMWRYTVQIDELERRVQLEAVFLTCGVVGLLAFAVGMLEMTRIVTLRAGLFYVLPLMFLVYGIANWWCRRKYGLKGCQ